MMDAEIAIGIGLLLIVLASRERLVRRQKRLLVAALVFAALVAAPPRIEPLPPSDPERQRKKTPLQNVALGTADGGNMDAAIRIVCAPDGGQLAERGQLAEDVVEENP